MAHTIALCITLFYGIYFAANLPWSSGNDIKRRLLRRRVVLHPCLLHVDEREVREVDRIGNLAEEFAKAISLLFIAL